MTRFTPQWLQAGSYAASQDRRLIGMLYPNPAVTGCAVTVASGMTVNIAAGSVAVPTGNNTGTVLCASDAVEQATLAAAPGSGTNRYDLIVCQARGNDLDGGANNDFLFTTVTGTAASTPTVPATPANAVSLAQVYIPGGSASVTAGNIADVRPGTSGVAAGRLAYVQNTGTIAVGTTEAVAASLTTPPVYIPSATRLVRVEGFYRNWSGSGGEAIIARIREGTTVAGGEIIQFITNSLTAGTQNGTGGGGMFGRTYAPGAGLKQWCVTTILTTGLANIFGSATAPTWLEVRDVGPG